MMKMKRPVKAIFKSMDSFKAKVLQLPYAGKRMSMILLLPEKRLNIEIVEEKLKGRGLSKLMKEFDEAIAHNETSKVRVILPKFKLKKTLRLNTIIKQMGMTDMFSRHSNFEKMFGDGGNTEQMKLSEVGFRSSGLEGFRLDFCIQQS